jgi:hypothetical protein
MKDESRAPGYARMLRTLTSILSQGKKSSLTAGLNSDAAPQLVNADIAAYNY